MKDKKIKGSHSFKTYKSLSKVAVVLLSLLLTAVSLHAQDDAGALRVEIADIRSSQGGNIIIALYNGKENWLKKEKTYEQKRVAVDGDVLSIDFRDIPYGDAYALFLFHDANANDTLDFHVFPIPRPSEGVGVSNNAVRFGRPHYEKARFQVDSNQVVMQITMHY